MTFVRPLSALITAIVAGVTHNYTGRNYGALSFRRYLHALDNACGQYSLYVCASASTPIAAALILKGMSPGNSSGLSLAGPATNMATISVVIGAFGKKALIIYLFFYCSLFYCYGTFAR
jgi:uncharacterized membrane protein YraQ (UPF0718 family)